MKKIKAFTLIELLTVMSIISILAMAGGAIYGNSLKKSRNKKRDIDLTTIEQALSVYKNEHGCYPTSSLNDLVNEGVLHELPKDPKGTDYEYSCTQLSGTCCIQYSLTAPDYEN